MQARPTHLKGFEHHREYPRARASGPLSLNAAKGDDEPAKMSAIRSWSPGVSGALRGPSRGLRGALDGNRRCIFSRFRGRSNDFDDLVNAVRHGCSLPEAIIEEA